ncbi:hypothetical protein, partial [Megasphaera sp.]|uniref:hypothetical protein n=1 Tax=Megasphaera sp. TaxID=2023260 RepID=UPI0040287C47
YIDKAPSTANAVPSLLSVSAAALRFLSVSPLRAEKKALPPHGDGFQRGKPAFSLVADCYLLITNH